MLIKYELNKDSPKNNLPNNFDNVLIVIIIALTILYFIDGDSTSKETILIVIAALSVIYAFIKYNREK